MVKNETSVADALQQQEARLKKIETLLSLSKSILNIEELCAFTGLSKSTIYKFTHAGTIPHYKQAKHLWFDKAEIESWLKEHRGFNREDIAEQAKGAFSIGR
jgi:excisionase family DNA binding protein